MLDSPRTLPLGPNTPDIELIYVGALRPVTGFSAEVSADKKWLRCGLEDGDGLPIKLTFFMDGLKQREVGEFDDCLDFWRLMEPFVLVVTDMQKNRHRCHPLLDAIDCALTARGKLQFELALPSDGAKSQLLVRLEFENMRPTEVTLPHKILKRYFHFSEE